MFSIAGRLKEHFRLRRLDQSVSKRMDSSDIILGIVRTVAFNKAKGVGTSRLCYVNGVLVGSIITSLAGEMSLEVEEGCDKRMKKAVVLLRMDGRLKV